MKISIYLQLVILAVLQLVSTAVWAADIARDVRISGSSPYSEDGGFFEIGSSQAFKTRPIIGEDDSFTINLFLSGRYQKNGFFIEAIEDSFTFLSLGYNVWNNDVWSVDLIGSSLNSDFIDNGSEELDGIEEKGADFLIGGRATGYFGNNIIQMNLLGDVSSTHDGIIASVEGGRSWQVRNWNYHALLGIRYNSKKVANYYFGVLPQEASSTIPAFTAKAGSIITADIGVTYPISEHWVFRSSAQLEYLTENLRDSPIVDGNYGTRFSTTFSYVF